MPTKQFVVGNIKVEIHRDAKAAGEAAAHAAAREMERLAVANPAIAVIFATGASQLETLRVLTAMAHLPWSRTHGFHLDEYLGIDAEHPASFRRYLRKNLTDRVKMAEFFPIDGSTSNPEQFCQEYVAKLQAASPQLCLLGIGENGHLAFNDPPEALFDDPVAMKVVTLDHECRQQQLSEGWFATFDDVPQHALTLTIPTVMKVPKLIASVPGPRKAESVRRTLTDPITPACPATILRQHPDVELYLDVHSAARVESVVEV